jgi:transcriptional regulator with XRE-family HTH domain
MPWLRRTRTLYEFAGSPPFRQLARRSGISHAHIAAILHGQNTPSVDMLARLLDVLDASPTAATKVLKDFRQEHPDRPAVQPGPVKVPLPRRPNENDFHELTAAIKELTALLREIHQSKPDHH